MCNLYSHTKEQQAVLEFTRAMHDRTTNLPPQPGIFPDYAAPIVRNTVEGLDGVPRQVADAASGMGMTRNQSFWRVDLPLALPVMLSGLRVTAVQAVGLAAVSALIGAGGLGAIMFQGLFANALDLVLLGALPVILLAVATDMLFRVLSGLARAAIGEAA